MKQGITFVGANIVQDPSFEDQRKTKARFVKESGSALNQPTSVNHSVPASSPPQGSPKSIAPILPTLADPNETELSASDFLSAPKSDTDIPHSSPVIATQPIVYPLELGDIFCKSFFWRNASFIASLSFHLFLLAGCSHLLLPAGFGPPIIVLEALFVEDVPAQPQSVNVSLNVAEQDPLSTEEEAQHLELEPDISSFQAADQTPKTSNGTGNKSNEGEDPITPGDGKTAQFFGTKVTGNEFVYILDRSGSMSKMVKNTAINRLDSATSELLRSVNQLTDSQYFYVLVFSTTTERMFEDTAPRPQLVRATKENKLRLKSWVNSLTSKGGTDPRESIDLALKMKPNAIFLLSDGQFDSPRDGGASSAKSIVESRGSRIPINAIAFENESASRQLSELSQLTGGKFRYVSAAEGMEEVNQLRALTLKPNLTWKDRYEIATLKAIPMLRSTLMLHQREATIALNKLSFRLHADSLGMINANSDCEKLANQWMRVWQDAQLLQQQIANQQTPPSAKRVNDVAPTTWLLVSQANINNAATSTMTSTVMPVFDRPELEIERVKFLLGVQEANGSSQGIREALVTAFNSLSPKSRRRDDSILSNSDPKVWENRFQSILREREIAAKSVLRTYQRLNDPTKKAKWKQKLLQGYPETKWAVQLQKKLDDEADQ